MATSCHNLDEMSQTIPNLCCKSRIPRKLLWLIRERNAWWLNDNINACCHRLISNLAERWHRNETKSLIYAYRPTYQALYQANETRLNEVWNLRIVNNEIAYTFFYEQRSWFESHYWLDCDHSVGLTEQTFWFVLQWSCWLPSTEQLSSAEGLMEWILLDREQFQLGEAYRSHKIASRLTRLGIPKGNNARFIEQLGQAGYLRPLLGSSTSQQLLLPFPNSKIAGELAFTSSKNPKISAGHFTVQSHLIRGVMLKHDEPAPDESVQIMKNLHAGQAYLVTYCRKIHAVLCGCTLNDVLQNDDNDETLDLSANLGSFIDKAEITEVFAFYLKNLQAGIWEKVKLEYPLGKAGLEKVTVLKLILYNPIHWAMTKQPKLEKWKPFHDKEARALAMYGHLLKELQ